MMLMKIIGISLLVGFAAMLILGAVNRTLAKEGGNEPRSISAESSVERYDLEIGPGESPAQNGEGFRGGQSGGSSQYGYGERGAVREAQPNNPSPQAQVDEWVVIEGSVNSVDSALAVILLQDGNTVEITGRPWSFALENGFALQAGDQVRLTGFYEDNDSFEVGAIENLTQGTSFQVRDQDGRPLWAGRGWQG